MKTIPALMLVYMRVYMYICRGVYVLVTFIYVGSYVYAYILLHMTD